MISKKLESSKLRTIAGILSSPHALCGSCLGISETLDGVIHISLSRDCVLVGKSGKDTPEVLRMDLEDNLAKHSDLSAVNDST